MPHFGGQKGPEIARGLLEIENQFEKNLNILRAVKKTILDVKATSWHDDYNRWGRLLKRAGVNVLVECLSSYNKVYLRVCMGSAGEDCQVMAPQTSPLSFLRSDCRTGKVVRCSNLTHV